MSSSGVNKHNGDLSHDRLQESSLLKPCPCSPGAVACGYYNLNTLSGCPYDCSYCILQGYLADKKPQSMPGLDRLEKDLETLKNLPFPRVGNGELADSLAFPQALEQVPLLLAALRRRPRVVFEFKTKSANIAPLLAENPAPNIVAAWSLNPQVIAKLEEKGAPALQERLAAMLAVQERGYRIALHFDPLVIFPGWPELYRGLVRQIAAAGIRVEAIAWWSLGSLRFPAGLVEHIFRHRDSMLFYGELVDGFDGKYRYFKPLRLELFRKLKKMIQAVFSTEIPLYLCMEDDEAWAEIFPECQADSAEINRRLYQRVIQYSNPA